MMSATALLGITVMLCMVHTCTCITQADLLAVLFTNYNTNARPVTNVTNPVQVDVQFSITSFEVMERHQQLKTRGWFVLQWFDDFLSWNQTVYPIPKLVLKPSLLWLPDLSIANDKNERNVMQESIAPVALSSDGKVSWSPDVVLTTSCTISVAYFPFDSQVCTINIVPWHSEPNEQLLVDTRGTIRLSAMEDNTEWEYIGSSVTTASVGSFQLSSLKFTLTVRRLAYYHIIHILIPTVLMSYMNCFTFVMPIKLGLNAAFSMTIYLTFSVLIGLVRSSLPITSTETCHLAEYMMVQFCIGGIETCVATVTLRLSYRTYTVDAKSPWVVIAHYLIRKIECGKVCPKKLQTVVNDENTSIEEIGHQLPPNSAPDLNVSDEVTVDWVELASRFNTIVLIVFVVIKTICLIRILATLL